MRRVKSCGVSQSKRVQEYSSMIVERSSSSILRKTTSEPQMGSNLEPADGRWDAPAIELPGVRWRIQEQA